uniref:Uncharacterized protein n=2 Tax=Araucaria cunninghamii TaxID=56994 RepID=A0A0D6R5Z2_ARACU
MSSNLTLSLNTITSIEWTNDFISVNVMQRVFADMDENFLAITALVTVAYQLIFFVITAALRFDKVTDFAGATNFVILALLTAILKRTWHFRQVIATLMVVIWGLRLAFFLLLRILQWGEDRRLDKMRNNLSMLAVFWSLQALWVWTVSLPVTLVNASNGNPSLQFEDIIGWSIYLIGLLIEAISDQQKLKFKEDSTNKGRWCNVGLWKWSRHPNYFGEILLWWGVFVASLPVLTGSSKWVAVTGPIFITALLLFLSGIPLLEYSADKKFGGLVEYRYYKRMTSPLVLVPPAIYGKLPTVFKQIFLLEFPLYSRNLSAERTLH